MVTGLIIICFLLAVVLIYAINVCKNLRQDIKEYKVQIKTLKMYGGRSDGDDS